MVVIFEILSFYSRLYVKLAILQKCTSVQVFVKRKTATLLLLYVSKTDPSLKKTSLKIDKIFQHQYIIYKTNFSTSIQGWAMKRENFKKLKKN
jgi:hypothetical protein